MQRCMPCQTLSSILDSRTSVAVNNWKLLPCSKCGALCGRARTELAPRSVVHNQVLLRHIYDIKWMRIGIAISLIRQRRAVAHV